MVDKGDGWKVRMRRVFDALPVASGTATDAALAHDLAEERAAILEYDCGLPRHKAEALAYRAHGLEPPVSRPAVS